MKCTVIELDTRTKKMDETKFKTKKKALEYIKQRKEKMNEEDKKMYQFRVIKDREEEQ